MNNIDGFVNEQCNKNEMVPIHANDIVHLESTLNAYLPSSYKYLMMTYGLVHSPNLFTKVCDLTVEVTQVQDFLSLDDIISLSALYEITGMPAGHILFASDCKGNMFCFKHSECQTEQADCSVWFYNYDLGVINKVSDSFIDWLMQFNKR